MLFNIDGKQVPQQMVIEVGDIFKKILEEVRPFHFAAYDVVFFNHKCNSNYLNLESNNLMTTDRESEG